MSKPEDKDYISAAIAKLPGDVALRVVSEVNIRVIDHPSNVAAYYQESMVAPPNMPTITLYREYLNIFTILHEIAHWYLSPQPYNTIKERKEAEEAADSLADLWNHGMRNSYDPIANAYPSVTEAKVAMWLISVGLFVSLSFLLGHWLARGF